MFFKELACFILFSYQCSFAVSLSFASALLDYHVSQTLSTAFLNFFQFLFSKNLKRRKRDLNPRAAINDLLPFQGSPFGLLGISPIRKPPLRWFPNAEGGIRTHVPFRTNGFQDRLVMTTSIPLHIHLFYFGSAVPQCK